MSERGRGWAGFVAKLAISGALLAWVASGVELETVWSAVRAAHWPWIAAAFSLFAVGDMLGTLRWRTLLRAQGRDARLIHLIRAHLIGSFLGQFLPSTVGSDAVRVYYSWRILGSKLRALTVIAVDRLLGTLALAGFGVASIALAGSLRADLSLTPALLLIGLVTAGGLTVVGFLYTNPPWFGRLARRVTTSWLAPLLRELAAAMESFAGKRSALLRALGLSVLLQANVVLHYVLIGRALDLQVPASQFLLIVPLTLVIMILPISINGIGLRENTFSFFLGLYGVSTADAIAFAWIAYAGQLLMGGVGGLVYALGGGEAQLRGAEPPAQHAVASPAAVPVPGPGD
jgi:glycosyltransferase 2 family protein